MPPPTSGSLLKQKKIADVINPRMIQAPPDISLKRAVEYMIEQSSAYLIIAENKKVVGMFTESDAIRETMDKKPDWKRPVREVMTKSPLVLRPEDTVGQAIDLMAEHHCYHIPLVDKNQDLVGVLSVRTLVRYLSEFYPAEVYNLPPNPHQIMRTAEGG